MIKDEYYASGEFYKTTLTLCVDKDYELVQATAPGDVQQPTERVFLNPKQAIEYAKAILKNEGIHAID